MKTMKYVILTSLLFSAQGCGYFRLQFPQPDSNEGNSKFHCGGPGATIQVTSGTESLPGAINLQNTVSGTSSSRPLDQMTSPGGAATQIWLACGEVGLKCNLEDFDSVTICGGKGTWKLTTGQITIAQTDFESD